MDVVEAAPAHDHAETTVNAAHRVVLETLGALAHKKRHRAGGPVTRPGAAPLRYPVEPDTWSRPDGSRTTHTEADLPGDHDDHT